MISKYLFTYPSDKTPHVVLLSATFVLLSPILKQVLSQSPPFGLCHVIALALDGISAFSTHSS